MEEQQNDLLQIFEQERRRWEDERNFYKSELEKSKSNANNASQETPESPESVHGDSEMDTRMKQVIR